MVILQWTRPEAFKVGEKLALKKYPSWGHIVFTASSSQGWLRGLGGCSGDQYITP